MNTPWNSADKPASIRAWVRDLHEQSKAMFIKDGTHVQILFLFGDDGLVSINPVPPKTSHEHVYGGIKNAIEEHKLYAVIYIGESWMYSARGRTDHTVSQIIDGEIKVSELNKDDRKEVLLLKMESNDGQSLIHMNEIVRNGTVELASDRLIENEPLKWF